MPATISKEPNFAPSTKKKAVKSSKKKKSSGRKKQKKAKANVKIKIDTEKKKRRPKASSGYFGVYKRRAKYETRFSQYRIGTYILKSDAAYAYDYAMKVLGVENGTHSQLNFATNDEYLQAREIELKERVELSVDLDDVLSFVVTKVNDIATKE